MEFSFTPEELEIKKTVKKFVKKEILPVSRKIDKEGNLPEDINTKFKSMGLLTTPFPEKYGGAGGTFTGFIITLKELAYATFVPAMELLQNYILGTSILTCGSDFLKEKYLPGLISLKASGSLAFTEADTGSDPKQLKTTAKKTDGGWILNGSKRFITYSTLCDYMILFAKTEKGVTAFIIDPKNKGYRADKREKFIHTDSIDNGDLYLENYFVPDDHVVGKVDNGFEILLKTEALGKLGLSALYVGTAQRAFDLAVNYAKTRTHRGTPIGQKFQMIQVKLARMSTMVDVLNAYLFSICAKMDRGEDIFTDTAKFKLLVSQEIKSITSDAMEIHGAYGLSMEYDVEALYRTAISSQVIMGNLDIQRVIIARDVLGTGTK